MTDDRFDELLSSLRDEYNVPPKVPREEMWQKLQAAQGARAQRPRRVRPALWWPLAAAALLLLGIGLGRLTLPDEPPTPIASSDPLPEPQRRANPYAIVAARHLDRAETLLMHFESGQAPAISQAQLATWARELLADTRLLMDSPAMHEPTMRELLADVELLLVLIVRLDDLDDPQAIADGLRNSGLLQRLRARVPAETV